MTAFACETPGAAAPLGADLSALIPTLKTDRLTLRAPALSDFPVLVEIDQSVIGTGARERTRHDSWADFSMMSAIWLWHGHGWWAVDDSDGPCGFVGLGFEPGQKAAELGYILTPGARGKGYATEAATARTGYSSIMLAARSGGTSMPFISGEKRARRSATGSPPSVRSFS